MQLKTILNRVQKFKSFVYGDIRWEELSGETVLLVDVLPRQNSRPVCSGCERSGPGYDRLEARRFEFVPLWGIAVFFLYAMRRVDCKNCGVKVESVPWAEGKQTLTRAYMQFLAGWAKRLSWKEVAEAFQTSWEKVFQSVEWIVGWGLAHRDLSGVTAIGVDEILWQRGHKYLTVVYQIDQRCKRLLCNNTSKYQSFDYYGPLSISPLCRPRTGGHPLSCPSLRVDHCPKSARVFLKNSAVDG